MDKKENIVIGFGRFQPPTAGHHEMAQTIKSLADAGDANHAIFTFQSHGGKSDPLPPDVKAKHMKVVLGTNNVVQHPDIRVPGDVFQLLHNQGYRKILLVAGGNRAQEYEKFRKYFGKRTESKKTGKVLDLRNIHPDDFQIHKIERDADADIGGTEIQSHMIDPRTNKMFIPFVSGSRMRANVRDNLHVFRSMLPSHVTPKQAKELQDDLRTHMKNVGLDEEVSPLTRLKLSRAAKRTAMRRKITRRNRSKRRRNIKQLKVRARNEIISQLRKKVYKGNWKKLSFSQRASIDKNISRRKILVSNMIKRIMPQVIQGENQRMKNLNKRQLNSSFDPILNNFFSRYLSEAKSRTSKESNRQPLDHAGKARRRSQNRQAQRNTRDRHDSAVQAGDIRGRVYVVKNKNGDLEIVDKKSLTKSHEIVVDAKDASKGSLKSFLNDAGFVNTKTSIALFGRVENAGDSKNKKERAAPEKEKKEKKSSAKKSSKPKAQPQEQQGPTIPAVKKASKKDTFATSHGATEMETGIAFAVNSALGLKPEDMVKMGLLDEDSIKAVMENQHQSFMPSCQRAADQILKQFGAVYVKHSGRMKKTTQLSQEAKDNGVVDNTPKSDLLLVDKKGNVIAGLSQKIGDSQLSSGGPAETITNIKFAMETVGDKMQPSTRKELEKFIEFFQKQLGGNPRTKQGPVSLYQQGAERQGEDAEVARREKLHEKATEMLNKVLNGDKKVAAAFIYALVTGAGKFKEGDPAIATHVLSANRDGTNLKMTAVDMKYAEKLIDKVKFQMKFKSSAVETSGVKQKWEEFKERKKKLGQKIKLNEDFRSYSFRSVIRAFMTESFRWLSTSRLVTVLVESLKEVTPQEPQTKEQAIQYLKDAIEYIGDDYFKLYQFFEDSIEPDVSQPVIDWSSLAEAPSATTNTVYINGKKFEIPVEEPYNYTPSGSMESPLSEEYLLEKKKRDYRAEYDNYHSKPEQRKNRSKRVLARRMMEKIGRVHKGDGKDVDHKDGNPRNNGKSNLRVRDKSENRADN